MASGPGKYNELCTDVRARALAEGVCLIVLNGKLGTGCSVQAPAHLQLVVADLLVTLAENIRVQFPECPQH